MRTTNKLKVIIIFILLYMAVLITVKGQGWAHVDQGKEMGDHLRRQIIPQRLSQTFM